MNRTGIRSRHAQRGVMFYLAVTVMVSALALLMAGAARLLASRDGPHRAAAVTLERARDALLAELEQPELNALAQRPGELALYPDLPTATGAGAEAAEPVYDGLAEPGGCAHRTWAPGQPLQPVTTSGAAARCFGQVPWRTLGLSLGAGEPGNPDGSTPWMIVSPNLMAPPACLPNLNPLMLNAPFAGYACPSQQPFPWLRVVDARGNLLSDRVAIVLIVPGLPLPGQVRNGAAGPAAWLDRITVANGCDAPCQPGVYDNAGYAHADNTAWTLIRGEPDRPPPGADRNYAGAYEFNDRLAFVTIDELLLRLQARAERTLVGTLEAYRSAQGYLPFAAPFGNAAGSCQAGLRFGHPPVAAGSCGAGQALALPPWFSAGGWHRTFVYGVSPRCVLGSTACDAPGLTVDGGNDVDAVVFAAGAPLAAPPFALSLGAAQRPLFGGLLSANPADWLDHPENAAGLPDRFVSPTRGDGRDNDRLVTLD